MNRDRWILVALSVLGVLLGVALVFVFRALPEVPK